MKSHSRRLFTFAAAAAMAALSTGAAVAQSATQGLSSESVIESIKEAGVIKVGISMFKPWTMRDKYGELIGFEIDVSRKLAEDMGVDVEFVPTAWDGIIPGLLAGNFDVIISGMTVTPQRNLTINFSDFYAFSGLTILANKEMTEGFALEDYNDPSVTFATVRGSVGEAALADLFPEAEKVLFDDSSVPPQEVLNGNVHALVASEPLPSTEARRYPDTLYLPFPDTLFMTTGSGFAMRKGDPDALNFFNNWIAINMQNNWLQTNHDYWFTTDEWADQVDQ